MNLPITKTQRAKMHVALTEILGCEGPESQLQSWIDAIVWNDVTDSAEILLSAAAAEDAVDRFLCENDIENCNVDISQLTHHRPNLVSGLRIAGLHESPRSGSGNVWATCVSPMVSLPVLNLPETILQDWIAPN